MRSMVMTSSSQQMLSMSTGNMGGLLEQIQHVEDKEAVEAAENNLRRTLTAGDKARTPRLVTAKTTSRRTSNFRAASSMITGPTGNESLV